MKKKFVSLLIAFIMTFAISIPVMAFDAEQPSVDPTTWEIIEAYHWVVRGDTLESIAAQWGTDVWRIVDNNFTYFHDLLLRNETYGGVNLQWTWVQGAGRYLPIPRSCTGCDAWTITLEPGVRLHIMDLLRATHFVNRFLPLPATDLYELANGALVSPSGMPLITTVNNIINENFEWFNQLFDLNMMRGLSLYSLEESFHMIPTPLMAEIVHWDELGTGATISPGSGLGTMNRIWRPGMGTPLVITVPVQTVNRDGCLSHAHSYTYVPHTGRTQPVTMINPDHTVHSHAPATYRFSVVTYLRNANNVNLEVTPVVGPEQQTSFNPWPTNPLLAGVPLGMWRGPIGTTTREIYQLPVRGPFINRTVNVRHFTGPVVWNPTVMPVPACCDVLF